MPKRRPLLAMVLGLMVAAVAASVVTATANQDESRKFRLDAKVVGLTSSPGFPAIGENVVLTGVVKRRHRGKVAPGAVVIRNTITGQSGNALLSAVRLTAYFRDGSVRQRSSTARATLQPDGSIDFEGKGRIVSGTGKYRGATGSFRVTGSQASFDGPLNFVSEGKISY
jgi:hypothetical protein